MTKSELICRLQRIVFELSVMKAIETRGAGWVGEALDGLERLVDRAQDYNVEPEGLDRRD
jgi:hypothetical protein